MKSGVLRQKGPESCPISPISLPWNFFAILSAPPIQNLAGLASVGSVLISRLAHATSYKIVRDRLVQHCVASLKHASVSLTAWGSLARKCMLSDQPWWSQGCTKRKESQGVVVLNCHNSSWYNPAKSHLYGGHIMLDNMLGPLIMSGQADPVEFKWALKCGPVACEKKGCFASNLLPLRHAIELSNEKSCRNARQICLLEVSPQTPFKLDRVNIALGNQLSVDCLAEPRTLGYVDKTSPISLKSRIETGLQ